MSTYILIVPYIKNIFMFLIYPIEYGENYMITKYCTWGNTIIVTPFMGGSVATLCILEFLMG